MLAGLAGSVLAGGLGYFGQKSANKANVSSAREAMQFSHDEYGTQYQRTMEDMRKAGLNPILAAKFGGGGAPSGVSAQSQSETSGAVSSALEARRMKADIEKIAEDTVLTRILQRSTENDMANKSLSTASQVSLNNALQNQSDSQALFNIANAKAVASNSAKNEALAPLYRVGGKISQTVADTVSGSSGMFSGVSKFFREKNRKHFG